MSFNFVAMHVTRFIFLYLGLISLFFFSGCSKEKTELAPRIIFKFKLDPNQQRLNNLGQPSVMPSGHAGQSPRFNKISAHYIELTPSATTPLGSGMVLYKNAETSVGGSTAIDF